MAYKKMDQATYDKMVEGFRMYPGKQWRRVGAFAGVNHMTAKRYWFDDSNKPIAPFRPIQEVIAKWNEEADARKAEHEASLAEERERLAKEAANARKLEEEATQVDAASLRTLRKGTLAGLVACAALTDGVTLLAKRVGQQLAAGVDAKGVPLDIDAGKTLRLMRDYSLTVGRLAQVVDTISAMERLKNNLPTAIMGIDIAHVTLEDAEREVAFAQEALKRAHALGIVGGDTDETDTKH